MRRRLREAYLRFKHFRLEVPRLKVRPTDCFVVSWPRSGNTWLRYLLSYALYPDQDWDLPAIEQWMPTISRPDLDEVLPTLLGDRPRMFKSHDPLCRYLLRARVVYIIRDGRDALVSLYNYRNQLKQSQPAFPVYLRQIVRGRYQFGSWQDHVARCLQYADHPNLLLVRYEHMMAQTAIQLERVLDHFGLPADAAHIAQAVERSNLRNVERGFQKYATERNRDFHGGLGGGTGRWQRFFTPADLQLFMARAEPLMNRLGYLAVQDAASVPDARANTDGA